MSHTTEERIATLTETLITRFKYKKREAKALATEAMQRLDRYVYAQEVIIKRFVESRKK